MYTYLYVVTRMIEAIVKAEVMLFKILGKINLVSNRKSKKIN